MITIYGSDAPHHLIHLPVDTPASKILWVDIVNPSPSERNQIEKKHHIKLPLHQDLHQLEYSNRFYQKDNVTYLLFNMVTKAAPHPESHVVAFILTPDTLLTLRYAHPTPIDNFVHQISNREYYVKTHLDIFYWLLDAVVGNIADIFELIGERTEQLSGLLVSSISHKLHKGHTENLNHSLKEINNLETLLSKAYQSLSTLKLLLGYVQQIYEIDTLKNLQLDMLTKDITTLSNHGAHLIQRLGFQLQSTLGLINIEQTHIIKIFTVLAMVFMPPTLIASIYGMNFKFMPELSNPFGYPLALLIMIGSSYMPYRFFKYKGWI